MGMNFRNFKRLFTLCLFLLAMPAMAAESLDKELIYRVNVSRAADMQILLEQGANANAKDQGGLTALMLASQRRDSDALEIVKLLHQHGAKLNEVGGDEKRTALHIAAESGNPDVVRYLLENDADFHLRDAKGRDALQTALHANQESTAALLQEAVNIELARAIEERSRTNMLKLARSYAYYSCGQQYLYYYLDSDQDMDIDKNKVKQAILDQNKVLDAIGAKLRMLFGIQTPTLKHVGDASREMVFGQLEDLVSNSNRRKLGVGTLRDLKSRCALIASCWQAKPQKDKLIMEPTAKPSKDFEPLPMELFNRT